MTSAAAPPPSRITMRVEHVRAPHTTLRSVIPPGPRSAKIELTARCDLGCYFCASHTRPRAKADMAPELYRRLARELRDAGVEQLGLFYIGESFLCDGLADAIRYAKQECGFPYVFLTTNGLAATPERVRECMRAGLDSLKFAFNWASGEQFEHITGGAALDHAQVLRNLQAARSVREDVRHETGHRCAVYASSLCYEDDQRSRMAPVLGEIGPCVDEHYWLPLLGHAGTPGADTGRPVPVKPLPCGPLFTEAHITWDGHLCACSLDASPRFHMGDLNAVPFKTAWHSPEFQRLRAAHLAGDVRGTVCSQCIAYRE